MSIDGIRAVDKEPLAAVDYVFGWSNVNGQRIGPRPIGMQAVSQQIASYLPLGNVKSYASVAAMNADVTPAMGTLAYAEGKTYRKTGASGSAGWEVFLDYIPGTQIINAAITGGTANAPIATSASPVSSAPYKQIIVVGPFSGPNSGPMTVTINGVTRALVTNTGDPIAANYVTAKMAAQVVIDTDGKLRLFSYGDAAAIQAAAEAAKLAAEAARDAALGAASSVIPNVFADKITAEAYAPSIIPNFLLLAGLGASGDGGGGLYSDPQTSEPAFGPKIFLPAINRWFTGSETAVDIMRFGARRLGSGTSGVIAANDAAFADAKDWLFGRLVGGALPMLEVGPGVYDYSSFPNFAKHRAQVIGNGDVKLRFHGAGTALSLAGEVVEASPGPGLIKDGAWEMKFTGFQVEAPGSAAGDVVNISAVHESDIDIEVRGGAVGTYAGLRLGWLVSSRIRYRCAANGFGWYDNAEPAYGMIIDRYPVPLSIGQPSTSFCHIHADTTESYYGIWAPHSNGNMVKGTFQAHKDIGVGLLDGCVDTVIMNSDFEVNANHDLYILGNGNTIRDSVSLKLITLDGAAEGNQISGGVHSDITLGGGTKGNTVATNTIARIGGGSISDVGQGNTINQSWDRNNHRWWRRPKVTLAVTPVGTVYSWKNNYGDPIVLSLSGGTVNGVNINDESTDLPGANGRQYVVPPGVTAQWDASAAPTAKVWGL